MSECICHETVIGKDECPVHGKHPAVLEMELLIKRMKGKRFRSRLGFGEGRLTTEKCWVIVGDDGDRHAYPLTDPLSGKDSLLLDHWEQIEENDGQEPPSDEGR